jgi:hypothetical protein
MPDNATCRWNDDRWQTRLWQLKNPLLKVRKDRGWSVRTAAVKAEVAQPTWRSWELGRTKAHPRRLLQFLRKARRKHHVFFTQYEIWWEMKP